MQLNVGIVGVTGYTGQELLRRLRSHPEVRLSYLAARRLARPEPVGRLLPAFAKQALPKIERFDPAAAARQCDLLFLALPHGLSMEIVPALRKRQPEIHLIDLGGDFRLRSAAGFRKAYGLTHRAAPLLGKAVYGLPEWFREVIQGAELLANPGCYPTATALALAPLARAEKIGGPVVVDAKSGVSGAGRSVKPELSFCEVNEGMRPYKVDRHQHQPEMEQTLGRIGRQSPRILFAPHLIPVNRGLIASCYVPLKGKLTQSGLRALFEAAYDKEPFVRLLPEGSWPDTAAVNQTNFCDIGLAIAQTGKQAIVISAIDNLGKGAAGQAVQNMNLMFGFPETMALT